MATLTFEGETQAELVTKVRRWLASVEGDAGRTLTPAEAVNQTAELTKEALRIIAQAAPEPVAQSDLVKAMTTLGYQATDATRQAILQSLDALEQATAGGVVHKGTEAGRSAMWQMSEAVARQMMRNLAGPPR